MYIYLYIYIDIYTFIFYEVARGRLKTTSCLTLSLRTFGIPLEKLHFIKRKAELSPSSFIAALNRVLCGKMSSKQCKLT